MTTFATHNPLIHDFNSDLVAGALGHSLHDGTDLLGDPTLAANYLTHVAFCNAEIGTYNPLTNPAALNVDVEKAQAWIKNGAQPTDTVRGLLKKAGVL